VIDKNATLLLRFGRYGNMESCRKNAPAGEPSIGFAWPVCVRANDEACFVADKVNHRILRIRLEYLAEKEVSLEIK